MVKTKQEKVDVDKYLANKEYIANVYIMRCFNIYIIVYCVAFLLNLLEIFIVDKEIMLLGFIPSIMIYLFMLIIKRKVSLSSDKLKYFILTSIIMVSTLVGITLTYHAVLIAILPMLYAILYSSKKVMWYTYSLTVISTIIVVYVGYYFGVCDANMTLLTATKLENYIEEGSFILTTVNNNVFVNLLLFYIVPRCLAYVTIVAICSKIYKIYSLAWEKAEYITQMEVFQNELKNKVEEQTLEIREKQKKIEEAYLQTITALSEAVDAKDRYTSGHSKRVAEYSRMIARRMGKSMAEQEMIYHAGLLHDVGKIGIPIEVINKPGRLTDDEYELIKVHPVTGYHILRDISVQNEMAIASKYHHERYDGKGYPNGLVGENIPEVARILGVADSYDAMTSNRSYRSGLPQHIVRNEIEKGRGTQFDPNIADVMLQMIDEDIEYRLRQVDRVDYKVLIVGEDTESNQQIKEIMQEESIYEAITFVNTAEEVIERLEEQLVDLIIVDIHIAQTDVWTVLQQIRENYRIPIVIMSEDKNLRNMEEFIAFGCDDYITKPFGALVVKEIAYNLTKKY